MVEKDKIWRGDQIIGGKTGFTLAVRVTPRAKKNEISEILDDRTVKIRLTAPPIEGKANEALIRYLAEVLDISAVNIEIIKGDRTRDKLVLVNGLAIETAQQRINTNLARK